MGRLAQAALGNYELPGARFKVLRHAGNVTYRVDATASGQQESAAGLYVPNRYLLRIHLPGYHTPEEIRSELQWLAALRRDAGIPVAEPVPTRSGELLCEVGVSGVPGRRYCSLLRWVKGRFVTKNVRLAHYEAQGRLMARLHDFASRWKPPVDFTRREYDWEGLFRDDAGTGFPSTDIWRQVPERYREPFEIVAERVRDIMEGLGEGPDVYGIIHADLGVDANVLFESGEARAVDFDDSGFGYYLFDLAISLEHCQEDAVFPDIRDALLRGYTELRPLPDKHVMNLELFLAAFHVYWSLWCVAVIGRQREQADLRRRLERAGRLVTRFVEKY